ncbi:DCN1-like protein [Diplonema papillatum]|nr:DCN1-like protein [Diplonema papillatum]|eukprot:gene6291-9639_t
MADRRRSAKQGNEAPKDPKKAANAAFVAKNKPELEILFDRYRDSGHPEADDKKDVMQGKALQTLVADVDPTKGDLIIYILAWRLSCSHSLRILRAEWFHGLTQLKVGSQAKLKAFILSSMEDINNNPEEFEDFYYYLYDFVREDRTQLLKTETAVQTWQKVLRQRFRHLDDWCAFLQETAGDGEDLGVSRDVWRQLYDFSKNVPALDKHGADSAYPVVIDDFVEWALLKQTVKSSKP